MFILVGSFFGGLRVWIVVVGFLPFGESIPMTEFQGWTIIAELALLIFVLAPKGKPKSVEMEITKVGNGYVHGMDRRGRFYAVHVDRLLDNPYPKVGDRVRFQ